MMLIPAPGSPTVRAPDPALPAATAIATPSSSTTASKNRSHAVSPTFTPPPKLRLSTSAPATEIAQSAASMPSATSICPPPPVVNQPAFALMRFPRP